MFYYMHLNKAHFLFLWCPVKSELWVWFYMIYFWRLFSNSKKVNCIKLSSCLVISQPFKWRFPVSEHFNTCYIEQATVLQSVCKGCLRNGLCCFFTCQQQQQCLKKKSSGNRWKMSSSGDGVCTNNSSSIHRCLLRWKMSIVFGFPKLSVDI